MNKQIENAELKSLDRVIHQKALPLLNKSLSFFKGLLIDIANEENICERDFTSSWSSKYCGLNDISEYNNIASDTTEIAPHIYQYLHKVIRKDDFTNIRTVFRKIEVFFTSTIPNLINKLHVFVIKSGNTKLINIFNSFKIFIHNSIPVIKDLIKRTLNFASKHKNAFVRIGGFLKKFFKLLAFINLAVEVNQGNVVGTIRAIVGIILLIIGAKFALLAALISIILLILDEVFKKIFGFSFIQTLLVLAIEDIIEKHNMLINVLNKLPHIIDKIIDELEELTQSINEFFESLQNTFEKATNRIDQIVYLFIRVHFAFYSR